MFEERIAAMNQRTEEAMAANAVQFDKRTYTAVSYTHLDVYKRQLYNFPVSNVLSDPVDIQNLVSSVYQRNGQTLL